jgi:hypothetical protein
MSNGLVDFRTHFHGRSFFAALAARSPQPGTTSEKLARVAAASGLELPPAELSAHVERWLGELDAGSLSHAVSIADLPEEADDLAEAASLAKGKLSAFAVVDPRAKGAPERARELLERRGFRGLVVLPALHHFRLDGPELDALLDATGDLRACVLVACGMLRLELYDLFLIPRDFKIELANPLHLVPTADRHPRARFVLLSMGGGFFRETLMAGAQCANVYAETSRAETWLFSQPDPLGLPDALDRLFGVYGPERVLFGTGSSTFPPGWQRGDFTAQREAIGACGLDDRERALVFGGNAAKLLGL